MCPVALGNREARYPALGPDKPEPHEAKKLGGGRVVLEAHRHGVKSANRHVFGHAAPGPRLPVVAFVFHKCEAVAVWAGEGEELLPGAASLFEAPYVSTREASRPGRKTVLRPGRDASRVETYGASKRLAAPGRSSSPSPAQTATASHLWKTNATTGSRGPGAACPKTWRFADFTP